MKKEMTYKEVLALATERMGIFGYYPHEIEKAAKAWYKEIVLEPHKFDKNWFEKK